VGDTAAKWLFGIEPQGAAIGEEKHQGEPAFSSDQGIGLGVVWAAVAVLEVGESGGGGDGDAGAVDLVGAGEAVAREAEFVERPGAATVHRRMVCMGGVPQVEA
jgi:hypothetical protein